MKVLELLKLLVAISCFNSFKIKFGVCVDIILFGNINVMIYKDFKQNIKINEDILIHKKTNMTSVAISISDVDYWLEKPFFIVICMVVTKHFFPAICDNRSYC